MSLCKIPLCKVLLRAVGVLAGHLQIQAPDMRLAILCLLFPAAPVAALAAAVLAAAVAAISGMARCFVELMCLRHLAFPLLRGPRRHALHPGPGHEASGIL